MRYKIQVCVTFWMEQVCLTTCIRLTYKDMSTQKECSRERQKIYKCLDSLDLMERE